MNTWTTFPRSSIFFIISTGPNPRPCHPSPPTSSGCASNVSLSAPRPSAPLALAGGGRRGGEGLTGLTPLPSPVFLSCHLSLANVRNTSALVQRCCSVNSRFASASLPVFKPRAYTAELKKFAASAESQFQTLFARV